MGKFFICLFIVTAIIAKAYSQPQLWEKNINNPVLPKGSGGEWDSNIVENPYVSFVGAVYHMWYAGSDGTGLRIGYAHSSDGIIWTKDTINNPVLGLGLSGSWDEGHVLQPSVIFDGTSYHMWYGGTNDNLTIRNIGYATSPDPINWTKNGNPVVEPGPPGSWDDVWVDSPNVLFINGVYHMWYCGFDGTYVQTGHATSLNGITWNKDTLNPVLTVGPSGSWDEFWVYQPSVIFDGNKYHMWYSGGVSAFAWRIGYAYSFDGSNWTKYDDPTTMTPPYAESDIVLSTGPSGSWEDTYVGQSSVIFNNDLTKFKMWYGGGTGFGMGEIGYATAPVTGIKFLGKNLPNGYALDQNYPNPFNPTTHIEFSVPNSGFVRLKVYNVLGEEVVTLVSERLAAGSYIYDWDGSGLASGVYLYRIQTQDYAEVRKMILKK